MKFRTEIKIKQFDFQIDYHSKIFGLGSCFVNHIAQKMEYFQFRHNINSFGVVFNPFSIRNILERIVMLQFFNDDDLFYFNDIWKSYELHSSMSHPEKTEMLRSINQKIKTANLFLKDSRLAVFTFGTAWVYQHKETGEIVSNCHKVPQEKFEKKLMSIDEIKVQMKQIIKLLQASNPKIKILFTLSPVRHLKDGFVENQHSKARLLESILHHVDYQNVYYFPSYEILMDDLRDYRFYQEDLLHPGNMAIDYVWEQFQMAIFDHSTRQHMTKVERIRKNLQHKPFRNKSKQFIDFQKNTNKEIEHIIKDFPWMRFS